MSHGIDISTLGQPLLDDEFGDVEDDFYHFGDGDSEKDLRPMYGPFFPGMYKTREDYEESLVYEEWTKRRTAFREKLDVLSRMHNSIFLRQKDGWERNLTNLEGDIEKLIAEFTTE